MSLPFRKSERLQEVEKLRAENERLRAALGEIADHKDIMSDWPHTTEAMQMIARQAINSDSH